MMRSAIQSLFAIWAINLLNLLHVAAWFKMQERSFKHAESYACDSQSLSNKRGAMYEKTC